MSTAPQKRPLTDKEKEFVRQAEEGCFDIHFDEKGEPFAYGAPATGNLFSAELDVDEQPEQDGPGSHYYLRQ